MKQSKRESWLEIFFNYFTGFIVAYYTYEIIVMPNPWIHDSAFIATSLFTVVSIIRSFLWRRFFNAGLHKVVYHAIVRTFS